MRITCVAVGSTGDVAPYLGVAAALAEDGHDVTVATHRPTRTIVESLGLGYLPLPMDPASELSDELAARLRRGGMTAARAMQKVFAPWALPLVSAIDDAVDDCDLLLLSTLAWPGAHSARLRSIPSIGLHLQPLEPTAAFPPPTAGARSLGRLGNRALWALAARAMVDPYVDILNDLRARHGAPGMTRQEHRAFKATRRVLYGFSPSLIPRPKDWPRTATITGYWHPPAIRSWQPTSDLEDFLADGDDVVYVGFGSTVPATSDALNQVVTEALARTSLRAVVQRGWAGLSPQSDRVLCVDAVDHSWLFPRVRAAVHHAGAGTLAAAMTAGVPSVPVPVALDQPFWAAVARSAGVATDAVPARRLTAKRLASSLDRAVSGELDASCARVSAQLAEENGVAEVCRAVDALHGAAR